VHQNGSMCNRMGIRAQERPCGHSEPIARYKYLGKENRVDEDGNKQITVSYLKLIESCTDNYDSGTDSKECPTILSGAHMKGQNRTELN
jgi:hypothetical protein